MVVNPSMANICYGACQRQGIVSSRIKSAEIYISHRYSYIINAVCWSEQTKLWMRKNNVCSRLFFIQLIRAFSIPKNTPTLRRRAFERSVKDSGILNTYWLFICVLQQSTVIESVVRTTVSDNFILFYLFFPTNPYRHWCVYNSDLRFLFFLFFVFLPGYSFL